jgi:hypothetical protein
MIVPYLTYNILSASPQEMLILMKVNIKKALFIDDTNYLIFILNPARYPF